MATRKDKEKQYAGRITISRYSDGVIAIRVIDDVDNMLGCTCIRFYDYSPHHPNCPLSNMEVTHEAH